MTLIATLRLHASASPSPRLPLMVHTREHKFFFCSAQVSRVAGSCLRQAMARMAAAWPSPGRIFNHTARATRSKARLCTTSGGACRVGTGRGAEGLLKGGIGDRSLAKEAAGAYIAALPARGFSLALRLEPTLPASAGIMHVRCGADHECLGNSAAVYVGCRAGHCLPGQERAHRCDHCPPCANFAISSPSP